MLCRLRKCVARSASSGNASSLWRFRTISSTSTSPLASPTTAPLFPYGISDFGSIREQGQFFVDNSRFIPLLEATGKRLFCVRPPRFGKSLFVDMLVRYYDCHESAKAEFDSLFCGLEVHERKTPLASAYHVLPLDFSIDTGDIHARFTTNTNDSIRDFKAKYALDFDINEGDCFSSLKRAASAVQLKGGKLYVVIDEYDRYANKLLVERRDEYNKFVVGQSGVMGSSPIRSFLETLKAIRGFDVRFFITGIMPLALADASGFNVATDITHEPFFGELVGFRKSDLERGLDRIDFLTTAQRSDALRLMQRFFNGYRFVGAKQPLYNPTLSLHLLRKLTVRALDIDTLVDMEKRDDRALVDTLGDKNVRLSDSFVQLARSVPTGESAVASLMGTVARLDAPLIDSFRLSDLDQLRPLQALLFHQGIATFADETYRTLKVPNEMIREALLLPLARSVNFRDFDALVRAPTAPLLAALLREIADAFRGQKMLNESTFQTNIAATLMKLCRGRERVTTEFGTTGHKRLDVLVLQDNVGLIFEVKRIDIDSLNTEDQNAVQSAADDAALLRVPKVADTVRDATQQVLEYADELKTGANGKRLGIVSDTALHAFVAVWVGGKIVVCAAK
jgi:hypothetical protein